MSFFEWWGESRNPGSVGHAESGAPLPTVASSPVLYVRGAFGAAMIGGGIYVAMRANNLLLGFGLLAIYLGLAYFVHPRPDYSNVGLLGGVVDHPLRWSDDVNRKLAFARVLLWPGRFAVVAVRDTITRLHGKRVIVLPRSDD